MDPMAEPTRRFRVKPIPHRHHAAGKRRIRHRLDKSVTPPSPLPVFTAPNLHFDLADKTQAIPCAVMDAAATVVAAGACCKQGIDIAYDGTWGYHPLIISLANTGEVLSLVNRSGNRPSHEGAAEQLDLASLLCRQAGFRKIYLRGDTDFTQTKQLDSWDAEGVTFLFGIDARAN